MSSNLLQPIMKNDLEIIDFTKNPRIDVFYEPVARGSVKTVAELMKIIDNQCLRPGRDETFNQLLKNHLKNFGNLLASGKFADFTINVKGIEIFKCHKCILAAQSEDFAQIFKTDPNLSEMRVDDVSPETVREFLTFFYTGQV